MALGQGFNRAAPTAPVATPAPPAPGGFVRSAPAPVAGRPPVQAPPSPVRSRWAGVQSAEPKTNIIGFGTFRLRLLSSVQGFNPGEGTESCKTIVEVVDAAPGSDHEPGEKKIIVNKLAGRGMQSAMARQKALVVAFSGYSNDSEYDAIDNGTGLHLDSTLGAANQYSAWPIVGRLADVRITKGNPILDADTKAPTGDFWREFEWAPVAEAEQDQTPQPGAGAGAAAVSA